MNKVPCWLLVLRWFLCLSQMSLCLYLWRWLAWIRMI